jgi:predicted kinase
MNLKKLITESVLTDQISDIGSELVSIKEELENRLIIEGVDDPGILKCVFMAGGPGSGKSYTAMEVFGIDKKLQSSFSATGLKSVNSDTAYVNGLKKNGINPKDLATIEKDNPALWDMISGNEPTSIRNKAKGLTAKQRSFYEAGRLGMIIDGTGHNYEKVKRNKEHAESLGYDTYMVFVNTSLQVARERNLNRDRVLPDDLLTQSWQDVQNNLGKFKGLFGGNFEIVDNTVYKPIDNTVKKAVNKFVSKSIQNPVGKNWISTARALKKSKLIK